jgi:hypothetical protein
LADCFLKRRIYLQVHAFILAQAFPSVNPAI